MVFFDEGQKDLAIGDVDSRYNQENQQNCEVSEVLQGESFKRERNCFARRRHKFYRRQQGN